MPPGYIFLMSHRGEDIYIKLGFRYPTYLVFGHPRRFYTRTRALSYINHLLTK